MVNIDMDTVIKYLALGVGAVAVPAVVGNVGSISSMVANIPGFGYVIYSGITVGSIVFAGLGVGLVDQLFFSK